MDKELTKQYYKIKEVSELVGVPQSTLRFWEKEFPNHIKPMRSSHNLRYYRPQDIETVRLIHYLIKEKGLKIDAARTYLHNNPKNISNQPRILDTLQEVRDELNGLLRAMGGRYMRSQGKPMPLPTDIKFED